MVWLIFINPVYFSLLCKSDILHYQSLRDLIMMQFYPENLRTLFSTILQENCATDTWQWLQNQLTPASRQQFYTAFVAMPRKIGKNIVVLTPGQKEAIEAAGNGLDITDRSVDQLARIWLVTNVRFANVSEYQQNIETLFLTADVNEQVALYNALPVLPNPEVWVFRCTEGIRSNIGDVLEAIMCNNPYPAAWLPESAWNQLVLKAFFTEKPMDKIIGLTERANSALTTTLIDYIHERRAAGRVIHPYIWKCITRFISADNFKELEKLNNSAGELDKEIAALVCWETGYQPARQLLETMDQKAAVESGEINWKSLLNKFSYVL